MGVPVDISKDQMGAFFAQYSQVDDFSATVNKLGITSEDFVIQVTLTWKSFSEIPNILVCQEKMMPVVVEGCYPSCWLCGASGHMSKCVPARM